PPAKDSRRPRRATGMALDLVARLARAPHAFDFHVALRRIEGLFPDRPRLGTAARPADEAVRFGQEPSLAFTASPIHSFEAGTEGRPARLLVTFFGLFGPHGPLPLHLTEYARDRRRNAGDHTLVKFADLFHHRMLLFFYRAWAMAQPTTSEDRPESNRFDLYVGSMIGLALNAIAGKDHIPDRTKLYYAGRISHQTRNAEGLRDIVADYLGVSATIEQFVGEWVTLPEDSRFSLGYSRERSSLGLTTVLGRRVFQSSHRFRIVLGPLKRAQFVDLLPGSGGLLRLASLVHAYVGDELAWDARLVLAKGESDQLELGRGGRLGYGTRLGEAGPGARIDDLVVDARARVTHRVQSKTGPREWED
ncbi:MAG TPA: type VI secretion system baseplate subunit TssG, partial [Polyangiaceae bacterium]|nr:type VI secretion system baseplate subunit TssG [Polyangiaceae bacterium]